MLSFSTVFYACILALVIYPLSFSKEIFFSTNGDKESVKEKIRKKIHGSFMHMD